MADFAACLGGLLLEQADKRGGVMAKGLRAKAKEAYAKAAAARALVLGPDHAATLAARAAAGKGR